MMRPVTDPNLIKQLDALRTSQLGDGRQEIIDPELIKKLDAERLKSSSESSVNLFKIKGMTPEEDKAYRERNKKDLGELGIGFAQGLANIPSGTAELLNPTSKKVPRFNFAPDTEASNIGQTIAPFAGSQAVRSGAVSALSLAPRAMQFVNSLRGAARARPIANALLRSGQVGAETGYINALEHPENEKSEFAKGFGIGAPISLLSPVAAGATRFAAPAAKAAIGGIIGQQFDHPLVGAATGLGLPVRSFLGIEPASRVSEDMLAGINPRDVSRTLAANRRLGTNVTPAEASGNYPVSGKEGALKRTVAGGQQSYRYEEGQQHAQRNAINTMLDRIYRPTRANENRINDLYERAYRQDVDPLVVNAMMQNPVMRNAVESVQLQPAFEQVAPNNYRFLAQVDRTLQRQIQGARRTDPNSAYVMQQHQERLHNFLTTNNPEYAAATQAAQPRIVRRNIEERLNKEQEDLTAKNFYSKLLNSRSSYRDLLRETRNFPEAQGMIRDMRAGWKNLANMKTTSQSEAQAKSAIDHARNIGNFIITTIKNIGGARGDMARLNFIYSPNWENGFIERANIANHRQRLNSMTQYITQTGVRAGLATDQIQNIIKMMKSDND